MTGPEAVRRRRIVGGILASAGAVVLLSRAPFAGVIGSPHDFSATNSLYSSSPLATGGACSFCHIPHGARYGALWPRDLSVYDNVLGMDGGMGGSTDKAHYKRSVTVPCYDCHDFHGPQGGSPIINNDPPFNAFASNHKPQNVAFGFTKGGSGTDSGSTMKEDAPAGTLGGYYENRPPYAMSPQTYYGADSSPGSPMHRPFDNAMTLAKSGGHYFKSADPASGAVYKGDKLPCSDCHDPHAWDSVNRNWQAFFRNNRLYGYPGRTARWTQIFGSTPPRASTLMANPVLSGESSRDDRESRKTCILCHGDSNLIDSVTFNDINAAYTSMAKIIRTPATVGDHASGATTACVSCHGHNAIPANCDMCHGEPQVSGAPPNGAYGGNGWASASVVDNLAVLGGVGDHRTAAGIAYSSHETFGCSECHTSTSGTDNTHNTAKTNASMTGVSGHNWDNTYLASWNRGGYDGNPASGPASVVDDSCSNINCHSPYYDNNSFRSGTPYPYTRYWINATLWDCYTCHPYDGLTATSRPGGINDAIQSGSHGVHIGKGGNLPMQHTWSCGACHADPGTNVAHKDGLVQVPLSGAVGPTTMAGSYTTSPAMPQPPTDNAAGHRAYGTCSNVYCHSTVQKNNPDGLPNDNVTYFVTPPWGSAAGSVGCGACHKVGMDNVHGSGTDNIDTGSHPAHLGVITARFGGVTRCLACHQYAGQTACSGCHVSHGGQNAISPHVDGRIDLGFSGSIGSYALAGGVFDNNLDAVADNWVVPGMPYGSCRNIYCHSDGNGGSPLVNPAVWGDNSARTADCTYCHGGSRTSLSAIATGSHAAHVASYRCSSCHSVTAAAGVDNALHPSTGAANHVNGVKNVVQGDGYAFTYTAGSPFGSCSAISCHGGNGATWGGPPLGCQACHGGSSDVTSFGWNDNVIARIQMAGGWDNTGHGRLVGSGPYVSGNPAANNGTRFGSGASPNCVNFCHFDNTAVTPHADNVAGSNYFRLATGQGTSGRVAIAPGTANAVCTQCHMATGAFASQATRRVLTSHYGAKHDNTNNGGYFCWDCHEPHGDASDYMVQARVATRTDKGTGAGGIGIPLATAAVAFTKAGGDNAAGYDWADYVKPTYDGLCQACHNASVLHFNGVAGYDTNHNRTTQCTACHGETKHDIQFAARCDGCHGDVNGAVRGDRSPYPPNGPRTGVGIWTGVNWAELATDNASRSDHLKHITAYAKGCSQCHVPTPGSDAAHGTGKDNATMTSMATYGAWSGGAAMGRTSVSDDSCASVLCHSPYSAENPGNVYRSGTPFAYTRYWIDNVTWDCHTCHAYDGRTATTRPGGSVSITTGSHTVHVSSVHSGMGCGPCHPSGGYTVNHKGGTVNWSFAGAPNPYGSAPSTTVPTGTQAPTDDNAAAGHRAYTSCSNVYCHSTVQTSPPGGAPMYRSPRWGAANTGQCGTCHASGWDPVTHPADTGPRIATGSHTSHVDNATYGMGCDVCHVVSGCSANCHGSPSTHANGKIEIPLTGGGWRGLSKYAAYDNTGSHGAGDNVAVVAADNVYGGCWGGSNLYCHSNGNGGAPLVNPARWGDNNTRTVDCTYCHGGGRTSSAPITTGSHAAHVASYRCSSCHSVTAAAGVDNALHPSTGAANHVNGVKNVVQGDGYAFTYTAGSPFGSCSAISCHGGNGATWGGPPLACGLCHGAAAAVDNFGFNDNVMAKIQMAGGWDTTGHGRLTASGNYASGSPAANDGTRFGSAPAPNCVNFCHSDNAAIAPHTDNNAGSNYFRLATGQGSAGRTAVTRATANDVCRQCHVTAYGGGFQGQATRKVGTGHYGGHHSDPNNNGGAFCWDCHEPHGDNNDYMIQSRVASRNDNAAGGIGIPLATAPVSFARAGASYAWEDYVKPGFDGLCQICHNATVIHFNASAYDNTHNPGTRCTSCHTHNTQFEARCVDCHDNNGAKLVPAPLVVWSGGARPSPPNLTAGTFGSHLVALKTDVITSTTEWNAQCNKCHAGHGGTNTQVPMPPASWSDPSGRLSGTNMQLRLGFDNGTWSYAGDNGVWLGGSATTGMTEAQICWNCHAQSANNVSEWGFNTKTTPSGYPVVLATTPANFPTAHDGPGSSVNFGWIYADNSCTTKTSDWTAGYLMDEYDTLIKRRIVSVHSVSFDPAGQSSSVAANVLADNTVNKTTPTLEPVSYLRCSYCHDVHDLGAAKGPPADAPNKGKPFLRGTWVGNPYPPELPPRAAGAIMNGVAYAYPSGAPRNVVTNRERGGYFIDQNSRWPTDNAAMNTLNLTAGLCTLCHGTNVDTMKFYTGSTLWLPGMVNGHSNSTLGGSRANARDLFDAGRGTAPGTYGMGMQEYVGTAPCLGARQYACSMYYGCGCCQVGNNGWYGGITPLTGCSPGGGDYVNWYTDNTIGGAQGAGSMAHKFTCSKCHTPHAAGLPALLVHNCIDTALTTTTNAKTDGRAVNCHRKTSTADGWHKLAPGQ